MPSFEVYSVCSCFPIGAGIKPEASHNQYFSMKREKRKEVVTFVTTSFRERKTGLKPATPSLEG